MALCDFSTSHHALNAHPLCSYSERISITLPWECAIKIGFDAIRIN
jgi:hypothetical protein